MPRTPAEWIGKTDDTPFPSRVRLRIFERDGGRCQCECNRLIRPGEAWQTDHRIALINGGENRESNGYTLLTEHHKTKTANDVAQKAIVYGMRKRHLGVKPRSSRPMPGSRASGFKKKMDGTVERRPALRATEPTR